MTCSLAQTLELSHLQPVNIKIYHTTRLPSNLRPSTRDGPLNVIMPSNLKPTTRVGPNVRL